ncbi:MAG: GNAT family N-acetyltransferase [Patescibacteria group bacterium]|jgi:ASC-1-like (ASCH) protein/ribosomal protein S18 acetylase RimI-like enzyme
MAELCIREAISADLKTVIELMKEALEPYYGGDHTSHAERIFQTHISGGVDAIGHFSKEQKMFVGCVDDEVVGMVHVVGKRQGTYKISPLIVSPHFRSTKGYGSQLLAKAEEYAESNGARQIYCTVAKQNTLALGFFLRKGYLIAGESDSHYKIGIVETMLYKLIADTSSCDIEEALNISVIPMELRHEDQVRKLILENLKSCFNGIDDSWVGSLFEGYYRRGTGDINTKYKLVYVAVDRENNVLGVAGATPKKGEPIKVMPLCANNICAMIALLRDLPFVLSAYGHKLYIHIVPGVEETIVLQKLGWSLDAAMPAAYHPRKVTQQWSFKVGGNTVRTIRVKNHLLRQITSGQKTIEVRVGYDNIKTIRPGEDILLASSTEQSVIHVKDVRVYGDFEEMLNVEDHTKIVPDKNWDQVLWLLREIYSEEREALGVYVLEIEVKK